MKLIDLINIGIKSTPDSKNMLNKNFSLSPKDIISLKSKFPYNAQRFIKLIATLSKPEAGTYRYKGNRVDFTNYKNLLSLKRKIAYIAQDAGLISNRTIYENILLGRFYFEDSLSIDLDDKIKQLIQNLNFKRKLNLRPSQLHPHDALIAIFLREISKSPEIILMHIPENLIAHTPHDIITTPIKSLLNKGSSMIFFSYDNDFGKHFATKKTYTL